MNKDEAIRKLKALSNFNDIEWIHEEADNILCELLNELGYIEVTQAYAEIEKWYA